MKARPVALLARRALVAGVAALALASCSAALPGGARELPPRARVFLDSAPQVYAPASVAPVSKSETDRFRAVFEGALGPSVRPMLRRDAALDLAAEVAAETFSEALEPPANSIMQWALWKSGATAIYSGVSSAWSKGRDEEGRAAMLDAGAGGAARLAVLSSPTAYGIARYSEGRVTSQAMVLADAPLEVDTFVKTYTAGAPLTLRFRPLDASYDFRFFADTERGDVTEEPLHPGADGWFVVERSAPSKPGRYFIEVTARYPKTAKALTAPRTVLWVPIYVDVAEPALPDAFMRAAPPENADVSTWAGRMADLYDAERTKLGKPRLIRDADLQTLALKRSSVTKFTGFDPAFHHNVPKFPGASAREFANFFGPADSPEERARMTLLIPSAKKKLLMTDRVMVGIGIATEPGADGAPARHTAVEYLLTIAPEGDAAVAEEPVNEPAAPKLVKRSPRAEEFLVVPLRAFLLKSRVAQLQCAPSLEAEVRPLVDRVNRVYSAAGIYFRLDGVQAVDAESAEAEKVFASLPPAARARPPHRLFSSTIPASTRGGDGFRLYFIHDFDIEGVYFGRGDLMVRDAAAARPMDGGLGRVLVTGHELGHGLGLAHRQDRVALMATGQIPGTRFNDVEVARVRSTARSMPGTKTFDELTRAGASNVTAAITALADQDVAP